MSKTEKTFEKEINEYYFHGKMHGEFAPGNIVPNEWFTSFMKIAGKLNYLALLILADIVYHYRYPRVSTYEAVFDGWLREIRDHEFWIKLSYKYFKTKLNATEEQARTALKYLEGVGVIKRHTLDNDPYGCTLYVELIPDVLREITWDSEKTDYELINGGGGENPTTYSEKTDNLLVKKSLPSRKNPTSNTYIKEQNKTDLITTAEAKVYDEPIDPSVVVELKDIFDGLDLTMEDMEAIYVAAEGDLSQCKKAVTAFRNSKAEIRNTVGWLIDAVRKDYRSYSKPARAKLCESQSYANIAQLEEILLKQPIGDSH